MGIGFTPALAGAFCPGEGVIDARERRFDLACFCFRLCKGCLKERRIDGGRNSGRVVATMNNGASAPRSAVPRSTSSVVGSAQCRSADDQY